MRAHPRSHPRHLRRLSDRTEVAGLMLLDIRHQTEYRYSGPVRESQMEARMQPRKTPRQRLVSFELTVDPAAQVFSYVDSFGNTVQHFDVAPPHKGLTLSARTVVETSMPPALPDSLALEAWDLLADGQIRGENFEFLRPHGFAAPSEKLAAFSASLD